MSLEAVQRIVAELPLNLRNDLIGYARSVENALPQIYRDAEVDRTQRLDDRLILVAALKQLHGIVSGNYWLLEHSLEGLGSDADAVQLGSSVIDRESSDMLEWQRAHLGLQELIDGLGLRQLVMMTSYADILRVIADEPEGR